MSFDHIGVQFHNGKATVKMCKVILGIVYFQDERRNLPLLQKEVWIKIKNFVSRAYLP